MKLWEWKIRMFDFEDYVKYLIVKLRDVRTKVTSVSYNLDDKAQKDMLDGIRLLNKLIEEVDNMHVEHLKKEYRRDY